MKKLILSVVLLTLSLGASAQSFDWGVKVNVGSPSLKIDDIQNLGDNTEADNVTELLKNTDAVLTYQLGVFARIKLAGIYIQPEAMFSNSKTEIKFLDVMDEDQEGKDVIGKVELNKVDVPVMIGKRFLKIFRVNAGPVFSLLLSENIDQAGTKETWNEINANYKNATVGLQYGIGVDISMISVDLRVEKGFQSISEDLTIGNTTFEADQRLEQVMLSVGIKF
jgi:hypothetical protein